MRAHRDFVEEAIAHHVPNPQSGRQRRRRIIQAAGGCCASQRVREGVPPTSSPQMDLAYDAVKPPPTWSCSSRPPRHRAPSAWHGADRTSSPHRNVVTAGDPSARRRGGGRSFGLCGSRHHQAQQESKSTSQGRSSASSARPARYRTQRVRRHASSAPLATTAPRVRARRCPARAAPPSLQALPAR